MSATPSTQQQDQTTKIKADNRQCPSTVKLQCRNDLIITTFSLAPTLPGGHCLDPRLEQNQLHHPQASSRAGGRPPSALEMSAALSAGERTTILRPPLLWSLIWILQPTENSAEFYLSSPQKRSKGTFLCPGDRDSDEGVKGPRPAPHPSSCWKWHQTRKDTFGSLSANL